MKKYLIALLTVLMLQAAPAAAEYSSLVSDLPLMPGMIEIPEKSTSFDSSEGRIVTVVAEVPGTRESVTSFYRQSLTQLGWKPAQPQNPFVYKRDGELLSIEAGQEQGKNTVVIFNIAPDGNE